MALLTDPDTLSQGTLTTVTDLAFTSTAGAVTTITSTANLPQLDAGAYFEIRGAADPNNNGLYRETGGTPTTSSITATKQGGEGGANPADDTAASTSFYAAVFTTYTTDGVTIASVSGNSATFTTGATDSFPLTATGEFISFQGFPDAVNNTVYKCTTFTSNQNVVLTAVDTTITLIADAGETAAESVFTPKNVFFDVYNREIWLQKEGSLTDDGVTLQALYSFTKEEWKNDDALIFHPFPFVAITPEQFEIQNNWVPHTGTVGGQTGSPQETRKLIRTGGWREIAADNTLNQEHVGVITLGTFEDNANDLAYFQQGNDPTDTTAATDFTFNGPVNEAVKSYDYITTGPFLTTELVISGTNTITRSDAGGSFLTDGYRVGGQITIVSSNESANVGTYVISSVSATVIVVDGTLTNVADDTGFSSAVNNRNVLNLFLRIRDGDTNGKTFDSSNLPAIGVTAVDNKVFRFPLANVTDLDISSTDATITGGSPWDQIFVRYFDGAFSRDVDQTSTTNENNRDFGIVIDVGTWSGIDGSVTNLGSALTSADGGFATLGTIFDGGTLTIHDSATASLNTDYTLATPFRDAGTSDTVANITGSFSATDSALSFTLQRASPVAATTNEIYEKVQYLLRQNANINYHGDQTGASPTTGVVTGATADALLRFVGTELESGQAIPTNPNGGGTGVIVEGFQETDFNRMTFFDNTETLRTFPFVASGTISFNTNLQDDPDAKYWMFFTYTERTDTTNGLTLGTISGNTANLTTTSGLTNMPVLQVGEYIRLGQLDGVTKSFSNAVNNGIFRVTAVNTSQLDYTIAKVDVNDTLIAEGPADVTIDEDPIDSPDAIIVDNNDGNDISANISGSASVTFTFDYDNNAQGAREAGDGDAAVTLRAIGFNSAQFVETSGLIQASDANNFSLVAALERNYSNEA